jgi:hypothetical protein
LQISNGCRAVKSFSRALIEAFSSRHAQLSPISILDFLTRGVTIVILCSQFSGKDSI